MDWIFDYLWTPLVLFVLGLWKMIHRHDKELAQCADHQISLDLSITEAKEGRKEIYDKIETVRKDLTDQHTALRKDQREDFKEVRKAIANIGK